MTASKYRDVEELIPYHARAFVTGSRKYGEPRPDSDIDLVIFVSPQDLTRLRDAYCEANPDEASETYRMASDGGPKRGSFRFGNLNLICVTDSKAFNVWRNGTESLQSRAKRTGVAIIREYAVQRFREWRKKYGVSDPSNA